MPGKDFEKQVQEKLEELRFAPSDTVWPEVEQQIARRRKRRVFFWLFFLALTAGGSFSLWYAGDFVSHQSSKTTSQNTVNLAGTDSASKAAKHNRENSGDTISGLVQHAPAAAIGSVKHSASAQSSASDPLWQAVTGGAVKTPPVNAAGKKTAAYYSQMHAVSANPPGKASKSGAKHGAVSNPRVKEEGLAATVEKQHQQTAQGEAGNTVTISNWSATNSTGETNAIAKDSPAAAELSSKEPAEQKQVMTDSAAREPKKPAMAKRKRLDWGILLGAGASNILNGLSGSGAKMSFASSPSSATGGNLNGSTVTGTVPTQRAGFAWSAGLSLQYPVGKKGRLVSGLQYDYFSTSMTVGLQQPSAVMQFQYARTGASTDYTNHFHFLSIPVLMQQRLGKSRFSLEGGAALSILLGSDALLYDAQKDLFTRAGSSITNPQVQLLTGFNYGFSNRTFNLELGPRFSYGLTNIFGAEPAGARHLMYAGIHAGIFFRQKK